MPPHDVLIIGAGAAGLMCAVEAGKRGRRVLLVDHAAKPAEKIRISGGGRCNFTNLHTTPKNFLSENPAFCISALKRYAPQHFIALVEKHGIAYHEKTLGQLFCDGSSQQIIDMLLAECAAAGVQIALNTTILNVEKTEQGFRIQTESNALTCQSLVIATGGMSIPKMGATGFGYDIARQFGVNVITPRPALVPFVFAGEMLEQAKSLTGVATEAVVACGKQQFREAVLFTHRGMSGPVILQISSYWREGEEVTVSFAPGVDVFDTDSHTTCSESASATARRRSCGGLQSSDSLIAKEFDLLKHEKETHPKQEVATALAQQMPKRLAQALATGQGRLADASHKSLQALAEKVQAWRIIPAGTEGFRTAEVTLGGVDTRALSSQTMECTTVPGLYFIGEVVDVTGHLGGFNFQWAWASGHAAGQVA